MLALTSQHVLLEVGAYQEEELGGHKSARGLESGKVAIGRVRGLAVCAAKNGVRAKLLERQESVENGLVTYWMASFCRAT